LEPTEKINNSEAPSKVKAPTIFPWRYVVPGAFAWTLVVLLFLAGTLHQESQATQSANQNHAAMVWLSHTFFWLLGLGGIALISTRLGRNLFLQKRRESDLQDGDQTLETLVKSAPLPIMALDDRGCVRLWNPASESIFGWRASEAVGQPPLFLPENPDDDFLELYNRGVQGEPIRLVGKCRHRNGMAIDISFSMSPLLGPQEELTGVVAVMEDITERRQTQEELFAVNEKLKVWILEFGRRNRDITLLNKMGDLLQACQTVEEAYAGFSQYARRMFPEDSGALFILNKENNVLKSVAIWGKIKPKTKTFAPDECWALRMGQEHLINDPSSDLVCGHLAEATSPGSLCVPLVVQGENLGLLLLMKNPQESQADDPRTDSRQRLATTAARQIALSLTNLNLRNHLMHQAVRDPLTGLFNRRYMEETLEREIFRVIRKNAPLGIIMVDLDLFKNFNDTLGHVAGDVLLQTIGHFLRSHIRREDIACRYGGDEFVLILPEAPLEITQQRAEKLRQEVQQLQIEYRGENVGPVTISLGVASFPTHGDRVEAVLKAADAALYQAKAEGRNRVEVAEEAESD